MHRGGELQEEPPEAPSSPDDSRVREGALRSVMPGQMGAVFCKGRIASRSSPRCSSEPCRILDSGGRRCVPSQCVQPPKAGLMYYLHKVFFLPLF